MENGQEILIQTPSILLDACVLHQLAKKDSYGYELTQSLQEYLGISESTLYPIVRRLQNTNCLETYDVPHNGRNRRYYKITKVGEVRLKSMHTAWQIYKTKIDILLEA